MLQARTSNRKAFEFYNAAATKVARYESTLDLAMLDQALVDLDTALRADANYFLPANYKGIVLDLKGQSRQAVEEFDKIYAITPESFKAEVEYNRAIANYHSYSEPHILSAIRELTPLSKAASEHHIKTALLAKAALAQSYGMMVHHSQKKGVAAIEGYFDKALGQAGSTFKAISNYERKLDKGFLNYPKWIANNAIGISYMFFDDYHRDDLREEDNQQPTDRLENALSFFNEALRHSPNNWALVCNLGSAHMRLGHLKTLLGKSEEAKSHFIKAESYFIEVIEKLRPGYDFAFYELGRIHRFQKDQEKAMDYFQKALRSGGANPNVSETRIRGEMEKAENQIVSFN